MASVDRYEHLSRREFFLNYLGRNRPVIVSDALHDWAGLKKWNMNFFRSKLGHEKVQLQGDTFKEMRTIAFAEFLDEIAEYESLPPDSARFLEEVPYARRWDNEQLSILHDLIENDWHRPYFLPDSLYLKPIDLLSSKPNRKKYPQFGVYFSPRGALTGFHVDPYRSSAILCQIGGSKRGFLFPPEKTQPWDYEQICSARKFAARRIDVLHGKCPDYPGLIPHSFELHPGDVLYIPMGWAHEVFTISSSISLTYNFIHLWGLTLNRVVHPSTLRYVWRLVRGQYKAA